MIIFDLETTGLLKPEAMGTDPQPEIIEFAAIKIDENFTKKSMEAIQLMVKPRLPIAKEITRITGIKNKDVEKADSFAKLYPDIANFFLGESTLIAHNLAFDLHVLRFELERIDKALSFPWPMNHICTVDATYSIEGKRQTLTNLYKMATGKDMKKAHRAMADVSSLLECVKWLYKKEVL